ncbi:MAG: DUF6036 family nucleotidyltransferase [Candidatus Hodarchaeales archaeon]
MNDILEIVAKTCETLDLQWALIGGLALPAYGVTRATFDLDIAVSFKTNNELKAFLSELNNCGVKTAQNPKIDHLLFTVFSTNISDEVKIWLSPCDAFPWDDKIIDRLIKLKKEETYDLSVLSPEDFILTKLARQDRSLIDLKDVTEVILAQEELDWNYLKEKAEILGLKNILDSILKNLANNEY